MKKRLKTNTNKKSGYQVVPKDKAHKQYSSNHDFNDQRQTQSSSIIDFDFSKLPINFDSNHLPKKLKINKPGDKYEREADQMASKVMSADAPLQTVSKNKDLSITRSNNCHSTDGKALDDKTRHFFESRFGRDFSNVRVHNDQITKNTAQNLSARAYTVGNDISFGSREYQPSTFEGRKLIAHELAHVIQQESTVSSGNTYTPANFLSKISYPTVQRELIATGDPAGFAALANSVIAVQQEVVVSSTGVVSLRNTSIQGPPTLAAQELTSVLNTVINDSNTTTIEFIHGVSSTRISDRNVIVGNYGLERIDLDDISNFGTPSGRGLNAGTALAHEILEQYRKQVQSESYPVAHRAGLASEARAAGATIIPGPLRNVNASTIEIIDIYTYPDSTREEVTITVVDGNITNVTRRTLP